MNKTWVSADSLIDAFGEQAYHCGLRMTVEALNIGDRQACRDLAQANIELIRRGYDKFPRLSNTTGLRKNT